MYENPLTYLNYLYYTESPMVPDISVNMNTASIAEVLEASNAYLNLGNESGEAIDYQQEVIRRIYHRDYVKDRFIKDLMGMSITVSRDLHQFIGSLSQIDLVHNEYMANEKSDEVYSEASRGSSLYSESGLQNISTNYVRIFSTIMVRDDCSGLIYNQYEEPEIYDEHAIMVQNEALSGHNQYVLSEDTSMDPEKTYWSRNGQIYSEVQEASGNPQESGWYEKLENVVMFLIESPTAESNMRVLNSFSQAFRVTPDETAQEGKKYYLLDDSQYVDASVEAGDDLTGGTFYEIDLLASHSSKQYTLRYNGNSIPAHWYISQITETEESITIGPEILTTESIDSEEIVWQNA